LFGKLFDWIICAMIRILRANSTLDGVSSQISGGDGHGKPLSSWDRWNNQSNGSWIARQEVENRWESRAVTKWAIPESSVITPGQNQDGIDDAQSRANGTVPEPWLPEHP